ncbi:MAG: efflux RND transporter periplasmic adaptor subunit, partial [Flavisolibacter sp.]
MKHFFILTATAFMLFGCQRKKEEAKTSQQFCLTDTIQKKIVISEVKMETVENDITLSGKIEANEDKWVKVYPVVDGIVERMKVNLGDYVTRGQTLAVIRSSNIADYQSQVSYSASNLNTARESLRSTEEMFNSG